MAKLFILLALFGLAVAYPMGMEYEGWIPNDDGFTVNMPSPIIIRQTRSLQPGAPNPGQPQYGTQISPQISRGPDGTTNAGAAWEKKTKDYDINAQWNKNIRGPGRAKPTWSVGGTYRW